MSPVESKSLVHEHIDRCVELYGNPLDGEFKRTVPLASFEQLRADLLLAIGMLAALAAKEPQP